MALTTSERQAAYRRRALMDPTGPLLTRLQIMLSPQAGAALARLVARTGRSKRELIEEAIVTLERRQ